jgi:hypothetical protein
VVADYVAVLWSLVDRNQLVTLAADVFFINGMAFLLTVLRRIKFLTAEHLPVRMAMSLCKHLKHVLEVFDCTGFGVRTILMVRMPSVECNTTVAKEHVSKAKHAIWTQKEGMCGLLTTLPFEHIPNQMKIEFVYFIVLWLNAFLMKTGIFSAFTQENFL